MLESLSVPKRRVAAQFVLPGGASREVAVFLAEAAPGHTGGERLSDLLNNSGSQFIPALDAETNAMTFVHCENLALARVAAEHEPNVVDQFTIPTEHEVEVRLVDGQKLHGLITYVLPEAHSRLTDYLNSAPPFIPVLEGERVALVNKRHVAYVETLRR
ncbi:hypothetical protein [Vitiosangium sp. GDMCC 1.1324]|uniref:hypothetical protein n=1 Tax=Vitiosangium sp. (strain GDMCC 1.1324) TaxID=2138576 RepID=UPI000D33A80D|nr:hypothetical protein [Vitiosangium sp. GDMCC 1.1324]PTL80897.1 hypothetical protein DAT35_26560 [Vitiosangium sp. GDMCC 1.1324]